MIIAQLSDIHADGTEKALNRLDKVLDWLRPLAPNALIVSGDLAEFDQKRSYADVRKRLDKLGCTYAVVPGNVDDRRGMREAFGSRFDWPEEGPLCSVLALDGVRLIGLDVTVPGAHHGDAAPILPWLGEQLNSGGDPALIYMHQHPFFCGIDNKDRNKCRGEEPLSLVIGKATDVVFGVTCGHVHRPMFTRFAGLPASMAPSVARANKLRLDGKEPEISDPPGLLVHHINEGVLVSHVVMVD